MAAHAARRLTRMNANLSGIIAVELLCAAQGVEFRAPLKTSRALQAVITVLRGKVETLTDDRYLAPDIKTATDLIIDRTIIEAAAAPALDMSL